jgi:predicted small metal-binding protein
MYQLQCGHEQCGSQFTSPDKDELMRQLAQHLQDVHHVHRVTETLINYLESRCLTVQQSPTAAASYPARHIRLARPRFAMPFRFRASQADRRLLASEST